MEEVSRGLTIWDVVQSMRSIPSQDTAYVRRYYPLTPSPVRVVELVGHIGEIRAFPSDHRTGLDSRLSELQRNLKGIFRGKSFGKTPIPEYLNTVEEAGISLTSKESEFNVLKQLLRLGHICMLPKSGADFILADKNDLRVEVKSRHENVFEDLLSQEQPRGIAGSDPISLSPETTIALVSWATFAAIHRAMDEQKSQVMFCDLSRMFVGWLFPAVEHFWKMDLSFPDALRQGFDLAVNDRQAVVVFVSLLGVPHHLHAAAFDRRSIESVGKNLWDTNRQLALRSPQLAKLLGDLLKK